jgi:GT2 family glycosyltransferase
MPAGGGAQRALAATPGRAPDEDLPAAGAAVIDRTEILIRPAISVVVCAFTEDRWDDICRVLGSLRAQTEAPGEVILVIDHCPPLLRRARLAFPEVTIVPNHFQKGLAGGRNTGVAHAWGDVVAFIDDDAFADPDWLGRLADHYMDPTVAGVGGLVEPAWEHRRPGWFPPELDWVVGCSYLGMRSNLGPVRNFIGANMSFRREILAEIGGFSIELGRVDSNPFGCEETELCLRVSQRYPAAILLYEPAAAVSHRVRRQRARWRYLRSRCYAEGRSKATVASLAGAESALASERSYVRSTIPRGVCRSLWKAVRGRPSGLLSAFALVMAVLTTGFGYFVGRRSGKNAVEVVLAEDTECEVLDAEAWVLESERTAPDEQIWVLDPDSWVPAVDDWAPDGGLPAVNGDRGTLTAEPRPGTPQPPVAEPPVAELPGIAPSRPATTPSRPAPPQTAPPMMAPPEAVALEVVALEVVAPEVVAPEAVAPDAVTLATAPPVAPPEVVAPDTAAALEVVAPEAVAPDAVTLATAPPMAPPEVVAPDTAAAPEVVAPEVVAPEVVASATAPPVALPEVVAPEAAAPEAAAPEVAAAPVKATLAAGERAALEVPWWYQPPAETPQARRPWIGAAVRASGRVGGLLFPWACLAAVAGLWVFGLSRVQVGAVPTAGFGLVSALPAAFWAAAALLMVSFSWTVVRWPGRWPVLGAHLLTLVVILHATPAIVYGTLRYSWAWKHVGVVDYIIHHGIDFNLGGVLGIYQGWPGFFALNAFLTNGGGLHSALSYAPWALVANDLLWLGPVLLIARAFTADWRMIWITAWVFELGNWVGQDYFSPQAFAYFLFLTVIAVCLRWLGDDRPRPRWLRAVLARAGDRARGYAPRWLARSLPARQPVRQASPRPAGGRALPRWLGGHMLPRRAREQVRWEQAAEGSLWYRAARHARPDRPDTAVPAEGAGVSRSTRLVLVAVLVPLMLAIASSHQLTPVMLVIALALLAVFRHLRPRVLLPLVATVIAVGWIFYGGLPWLQSNNSQVFSGFGALWANSSAHIVGGGQVTPDQVIVAWGARLLSAAIGLMAMAGFLRFRRHRDKAARRSWNRVALLGVAAIPMVAGNSYGGEIIFRAFLFALPFMAVAAAALFFPRPWSPRRYLAGTALAVTTVLLAGGFFLSNYGTDAMNYFTPQEVTAAQWLYRTAPAGAQVIAVNSNFPWAFVHYNRYSYTFLDGSGYSNDTLRNPVQEISFLMSPPYPKVSYLVFTRSQAAQEAISGPWSPNNFSRVYSTLMQSSAFRTVYLANGVTILRLTHGHGVRHPASLGAHPAPLHRQVVPHRRTVLHRHKAHPPRNRALIRALRARYHRRHHPPTIGGRPVAP